MAQSTSTFRLINAGNQHNFIFTVTRVDTTHVDVKLEAQGIASATTSLVPDGSGHLSFTGSGATTFVADGDATWDDVHNVVRFSGNLRVVNVAEVQIQGGPVAVIPA